MSFLSLKPSPGGAWEQPGPGWAQFVLAEPCGISETQAHVLSRAQPWPGWELTINPCISSGLGAWRLSQEQECWNAELWRESSALGRRWAGLARARLSETRCAPTLNYPQLCQTRPDHILATAALLSKPVKARGPGADLPCCSHSPARSIPHYEQEFN